MRTRRGRRRTGRPEGAPVTARVVPADDQSLARADFRVIVNSTPDLMLVGEVANGREAVALTRAMRPDVVLMDIRMRELDGLAAAETRRSRPRESSCSPLSISTSTCSTRCRPAPAVSSGRGRNQGNCRGPYAPSPGRDIAPSSCHTRAHRPVPHRRFHRALRSRARAARRARPAGTRRTRHGGRRMDQQGDRRSLGRQPGHREDPVNHAMTKLRARDRAQRSSSLTRPDRRARPCPRPDRRCLLSLSVRCRSRRAGISPALS